jgi:hypothetical protein
LLYFVFIYIITTTSYRCCRQCYTQMLYATLRVASLRYRIVSYHQYNHHTSHVLHHAMPCYTSTLYIYYRTAHEQTHDQCLCLYVYVLMSMHAPRKAWTIYSERLRHAVRKAETFHDYAISSWGVG